MKNKFDEIYEKIKGTDFCINIVFFREIKGLKGKSMLMFIIHHFK